MHNTIHIENASHLEDLLENKNIKNIGITAGKPPTSDWIIKEVIENYGQDYKMEEQLLLMNEMDRRFKIGDEIEGEILSIRWAITNIFSWI